VKKGICDKCGAKLPSGARFCPECADPITEVDFTQSLKKKDPRKIEIKFGHSSSPTYEKATQFASKLPSYNFNKQGDIPIHHISFGFVDVEAAATLWEMVSNWKSSQMFIGGQKAGKKQLTQGVLGCYRGRQNSDNPTTYCNQSDEEDENFWGCFKLKMGATTLFPSWNCRYSNVSHDGHITVNKKMIAEDLMKAAKQYQICPAFSPKRIKEAFAELPEEIDIFTYSGRFEKYLKGVRKEISATERQLAFAERLGLEVPPNATKSEVSALLDAHLNRENRDNTEQESKDEAPKKAGISIGGIVVFMLIIYVLWKLFT
jgi:hypothetical protein